MFDAAMKTLGAEVMVTDRARPGADAGVSAQDLASIAGARILLAEDNLLNQQVATELLTSGGFVVDLAENGKIAVDMVKKQSYDIVLMDVQMPEMDGLAATREIRTDSSCANLPILAMTAGVMESDREDAAQAGMNDHVAKPIDPDVLFNALLKWIPARDGAAHGATAAAADISPAVIPPTNDLEAVAGLDVAGGVKRVLGKRDFYEKLVLGFATGEQIHSVETVRAQLAEGDRVAAERTAHSLKGVAGTIGMSELQQRATELESAIKESKDGGVIEAQLTSVDEELTRLVMAIKVATGIGEPPGLMARGEETVEELSAAAIERLGKLAEALEGKPATCEELASTLDMNEIGNLAAELNVLGKKYDYPPLRKWAETLIEQTELFNIDEVVAKLSEFSKLVEAIPDGHPTV